MGFVDRLSGKTGQKAAQKAGETQAQFAQQASALFNPLGFGVTQDPRLAELNEEIARLQKFQEFGQQGGGFFGNAFSKLGEQSQGKLAELIAERDSLSDQGGQKGLGQLGLEQAGFLTDPQAQFDFLQNNPLFASALENANQQTQQSAAARGRLSAGDTLQQLSQNTLLAASPLIQQQKQSIGDLLNIGIGATGSQANLLTGQGAALAGGIVGGENARAQGYNNLLNLGGAFFGSNTGQNLLGKVGL